MHKLMDIYNAQYEEEEKPLLVEMPQITSLLKHLDLLYSIVLKKQMENEMQQDTIQYYSSGQGSKSQADSVN
jgi:hypothetical protein|tara:strand:- start:1273 stop:1488 length:216 start_codon:yes stop_codon:yes gene_type:complete